MNRSSLRFARSRVASLVVCVALVLSSGLAAWAQAGRGGISGSVTDPSGAVVPGASVTLLNRATGVEQHSVTTAGGLYVFVSLNPGEYQVTASQPGFESVAQDKVPVSVDQVTTLNISLRVGAATEVVKVTGSEDLTSTSNSTVGQLIGAETIDRVPLLTRNVFDLVQLSAGVTPANGSPNSSSSLAIENISTGRPGVDISSYTINGAIEGSVYFLVDGSPIGVAENNAAAVIPALEIPEDAVEEIRVETQNTPASYQSGGAGVISLVTKSGSNQFHGDVFGTFRPDVLAANEFTNKDGALASGGANTSPSFHRYQEGAAIGGPILHDKLFFFADYEATQQQQFDGSNRFTVPTSAERTGDFSADSFTIYDPTKPDNADGTRQPFTNNVITNPNPVALKLLAQLPKCNSSPTCDSDPTGALNNFYLPGLDPTTAQRFDVRVDWAASERQRLFGRFSFARTFTSSFNAFNNAYDLFYAQNITNARNILVADDITLNPTTALQLRYSFTRAYTSQGGDPRQVGFDITTLGFPASLAAQENFKLLPYAFFNDYPGSGVGGTANFNTFIYASENSDVNATITKVSGKHEISTGFEYLKRFLNVGQPGAPSGAYSFDRTGTNQSLASAVGGSDFASFLAGIGTAPGTENTNFTKDIFAAEASPYYAAFIEDTYRPTKSLSINAGLRWDIIGGRTERHNRQEYFNPSVTNTVNGVAYTGAEVYVNSGNRSPFTTNLKDFSPRLGFSWQPVTHLVVRGGAGYYYGPSALIVSSPSENTDGFATVTQWNATCFNADGNTTYNGTSGCAGAASGAPAPSTAGIYSLSNPFPNGVVQTLNSPSGLGNNLGTTLNTVLHSQRTLTTYNYNFGLEYELPHQFVLSVGYVGSRGLFLPLSNVDANQLDLATIQKYGASLCVDTSSPSCVYVPNQWAGVQPSTNTQSGAATVPLWVSLQQFPQFGSGNYGAGNGVLVHNFPSADSDYSSLQSKVQKRLTSHFTTLTTFTWAKLITDDGNPPLGFVGTHLGAPQDAKNLRYEHSVSPQDVKYQFTGQASYDLPVGKGRALSLGGPGNLVLGGWTTNGIVYWSTGVPIASPVVGAGTSYFNQRPNLTCDPSKGAPHTAAVWFKPDCFAIPDSQFVPGNAPAYLDHVRTAGARDLDLSLYKRFAIGEKRELRLEVSSYNVTNTAQLGAPSVPSITAYQSPQQPAGQPGPSGLPLLADSFGRVGSTVNTPRQFQFASRFSF